jgi:hypothetical protein
MAVKRHRLAARRRALGFTQESLAERLGVHPTTVRRWGERRHRQRAAPKRATLLVSEDNSPARRAYAKWGWRKIGKLQPFPDSPHYDALVLDLPVWELPS